jgi:hypothetical protein
MEQVGVLVEIWEQLEHIKWLWYTNRRFRIWWNYVSGPNRFLTATEEYNGSTWGPGGNLGTGRDSAVGTGTQTAGLVFGGICIRTSSYSSHRRI